MGSSGMSITRQLRGILSKADVSAMRKVGSLLRRYRVYKGKTSGRVLRQDIVLDDDSRRVLRDGEPVIDASGALLGEIDIMSIRKVMFRIELYHHFLASQLMQEPAATLRDTAPMTSVMRTFDATRADWLPVLSEDGHLKGYISRQRLYTLYRKMVHDISED
jgi:CIC family chloride channel protein